MTDTHSAMATLETLARGIEGVSTFGHPGTLIQRVHTDTRTIERGDLFVALQGESFDANQFLHEAAAKGAAPSAKRGAPLASNTPMRCSQASNSGAGRRPNSCRMASAS